MATSIAVLGAGSWGTAVAIHLARSGNTVTLWARDPAHYAAMQSARCNARYLPDVPFPETLRLSCNIEESLQMDEICIAVPSHAFEAVLAKIPKGRPGLMWLTKGLQLGTNDPFSVLLSKRWGSQFPMAMLSGPSFAREVGLGLPTAVVLASNAPDYQQHWHRYLHHGNFRVYLSADLLGVEMAGAVKNVIAIACGVSDGMGYGANARAALITRGLAEMIRLGCAVGAEEATFSGLAGVGDLVLTCTDNQSRNRRFGMLIGQGLIVKDALQQIGQVVEGCGNVQQVCALALQHQIEMPICKAVDALVQGRWSCEDALKQLMQRAIN
ncbi:MAG: NAD(P)H-dependent glycerol-3-phosphate dehydrogenase [Legionellaceae bacterium]|nr:NAD(P)H-dependent glycerol-3-phosphate dehydrogenase [Legionellaceae bacterium]